MMIYIFRDNNKLVNVTRQCQREKKWDEPIDKLLKQFEFGILTYW